jgi:hypothetical protein
MGLHAALRDWKFGDDATIGGHPSDPTPGAAKKSVPTISPRSGVASLVVLGMLSSACASVFPTVAKTNAQLTNVIVDAELALDIADDTVAAFAFAHDVPEQLLRQYADASAEARRALAAARTALLGVRRLTQKQYDEAFQDFERAWADVERAIAAIRERVGASNTRLRDPIALDYGVR